jgi:hypothetical protein
VGTFACFSVGVGKVVEGGTCTEGVGEGGGRIVEGGVGEVEGGLWREVLKRGKEVGGGGGKVIKLRRGGKIKLSLSPPPTKTFGGIMGN